MARGELTPRELETRQLISNNINQLLSERHKKQIDISNATNIPKSTLTGYVKGTSTPTPGNIQKIADFFNIPKSSIDPRFANIKQLTSKHVSDIIHIPVINHSSFDGPLISDSNVSGYLSESSESVPKGNLFYLAITSESMSPTIPVDSHVLIQTQSTIKDGEIAAMLIDADSEITLKRIKYQNKILILMSDNPIFDPIIVTDKKTIKILGKATMVKIQL